ncbi:MAG TPA: inorganic phosphate transporter [Candidatus Nanoarchaeia archaeon]|nr:inorganic phosphate transporter [Candidatus Nanoarchaeia archaeon]
MVEIIILAVIIIIIALVFDFINGFHDSANAIATVVSTRVLSPQAAVAMAAFWNFIGAFVFSTAIAKVVGSGIIDPNVTTLRLILAALIGAIAWNLITWYYGLPSSSSHALIGGLIGAALVAAGIGAINLGGVSKTVTFIFIAPALGMIGGILGMLALTWGFRKASKSVNPYFRKLQLVSASFYSLGHGTNDAQKTMGIIAAVLFAAGITSEFMIPVWVILAAHSAIALGTYAGGWRIVKTMGTRITKLKPVHGFAAETAGGFVLFGTAHYGIPVSTTHVIAGSIMGVGSVKRTSMVRWTVARKIIGAWILTIPAAALIAAVSYFGLFWLF